MISPIQPLPSRRRAGPRAISLRKVEAMAEALYGAEVRTDEQRRPHLYWLSAGGVPRLSGPTLLALYDQLLAAGAKDPEAAAAAPRQRDLFE